MRGTPPPGRSTPTPDSCLIRAMSPDEELVARCLAGDQAAWNDLVRNYSRYVFAICSQGYRLQGADAEDAFQDVFVRVYGRLGSLRNPEALRPWIAQLTRRVCLDRIAARQARGTVRPRAGRHRGDRRGARRGVRRPRGARGAAGGVPGGARPLLLPGRELPHDRRGARHPRGNDREPHLALPRPAPAAPRGMTGKKPTHSDV